MMGTSETPRPATIERHIATEYARDTVAKALYEVSLAGVGYGPRDLPTSEDREWLRGAIAVPIQEATEAALHALAWHLTEALQRAPGGLQRRFDSSHDGEEVGWE